METKDEYVPVETTAFWGQYDMMIVDIYLCATSYCTVNYICINLDALSQTQLSSTWG